MDIDADVRIVFFYVRALTVGLAKIVADGIFDAKRGKSDAFKRRAAGRKSILKVFSGVKYCSQRKDFANL